MKVVPFLVSPSGLVVLTRSAFLVNFDTIMLPAFVRRMASAKNGVVKKENKNKVNRFAIARTQPVKATVPSRSVLTRNVLPPNVLAAQYAVRGPLVVRAVQIEKALKKGEKFPFSRITYCNVRSKANFRVVQEAVSGIGSRNLARRGHGRPRSELEVFVEQDHPDFCFFGFSGAQSCY